jgi:predicted transcriptional regulator
MVRTQIYLTEEEQAGLRALARRTDLTQSELIRQAIDTMLTNEKGLDRAALLSQARGLWADRHDLADFPALRRELDRTEDA